MRRYHFVVFGMMMVMGAKWTGHGEPWKLGLDANLTMTLSTYSDNWIGSERGALAWTTTWQGNAEKQVGNHLSTKNTLKLTFGQTKVQDPETERWSKPQKSADLIDFESVLRTTLRTWVDPFIALRITSQFLDGRDPQLPHYGNPIDFAESFGIRRELVKKPAVEWDVRFAGAARQHVDRIWERENTSDGGLEMVTQLGASVRKDIVKFASVLRVYEALIRAGSDTLPDWWRYPDIDWENKLIVNVTKYIMISYTNQVLYDREKEADARFRQALAVGLSYSARLPRETAGTAP